MIRAAILAVATIGSMVAILLFVYYPSYREARIAEQMRATYDRMGTISDYLDRNDSLPVAETEIEKWLDAGELRFLQMEEGWWLIAPGADGVFDYRNQSDDVSYVPYDPTNGSTSKGDSVFSDSITPSITNRTDPSTVRGGIWQRNYYGFQRVQ
ncbi:hypothetical protein HQ520_08495 [bacterium]|nr:hypothetical protein [bacterium]